MDPVEYLDHAKRCRAAAERSTEPIRGDFLAAAAIWELLAAQMEWLLRSSGDAAKVEAVEAYRRRH